MVFLRDEETAAQWKRVEPGARDVFSLPDAIRFAAEHFLPLLEE